MLKADEGPCLAEIIAWAHDVADDHSNVSDRHLVFVLIEEIRDLGTKQARNMEMRHLLRSGSDVRRSASRTSSRWAATQRCSSSGGSGIIEPLEIPACDNVRLRSAEPGLGSTESDATEFRDTERPHELEVYVLRIAARISKETMRSDHPDLIIR